MRPVPAFGASVEATAGIYLAGHGFSRADNAPDAVTYRRGDTLVSFEFSLQDLPSAWVSVTVGFVAVDAASHRVAVWRILAEEEPARGYAGWRFHDQASLDQVLGRIVVEVLQVHGPQLWESKDRIAEAEAAQAAEAGARCAEDRQRVRLLLARRAYDDERFQEAADAFVLAGEASLSAADRRRLYVARRRAEAVD